MVEIKRIKSPKVDVYYNGVLVAKDLTEYLYNGLDRVDSNKGYLKENVVPCCEICNKAKRDLSLCQFKKWINRLIKYNNNV